MGEKEEERICVYIYYMINLILGLLH